jgi:hypothetical protein
VTAVVGQDGILRGGWQPPLSLYSTKLSKQLREMEAFILELGVGFCFVARQQRIEIDDRDRRNWSPNSIKPCAWPGRAWRPPRTEYGQARRRFCLERRVTGAMASQSC